MDKNARSLKVQVDFRTGVPAYTQIFQQIQSLIQRQELRAGDQLPTVRQMAVELSIHFNTIARAYRLLDQAGYITTQQGRGTYVLERDGLADEKQPDPLRRMAENFLAQATRQGYPAEDVLHALILAVEQMQQPDVRNMPSSDAEDTPGKQTMFHVKHG